MRCLEQLPRRAHLLPAAWLSMAVFLPALHAEEPKAATTTNPIAREQDWWVKRHEAINARAKQGDVDLIFLGDSITQGWEGAGKTVWETHYAKRKAMNAGISGDGTPHVLWRLDHGNVDGLAPKAVVVMIGTNNAPGDASSAEDIAAGVGAIVARLREKLPAAKVLVLAIFPSGEKPTAHRAKTTKANELIAKQADGRTVFYLDIGKDFMNADATISKDIMPDYLHLSERGYEKWAAAIEGKVAQLLGEKPAGGPSAPAPGEKKPG